MVADILQHSHQYHLLNRGIGHALAWLQRTDLDALPLGKHIIDGDELFVIIQEYNTLDTEHEKMEAHKKYIDVQYMILGEELVGLAFYNGQQPGKAYSEEDDYMLFDEAPSYFAKLSAGSFMIFYPTDLHMPCIKVGESAIVKKAVVKVKI